MFEIHVSEVRSFLQCRRKFQWASLLYKGLEPRRPVRHFYLGRAVHYALQAYYDTGEHPTDAFLGWTDYHEYHIREAMGEFWDDELAVVLEEERAQGSGMLTNYARWAFRQDKNLKFIATELAFELPLPCPSGRSSSRIRMGGRFDGLVQDIDTGLFWLFETKTTRDMRDLNWIQNDIQAGVYIWAAQSIYGLEVQGVLYNFLKKKVPKAPRRLKNGGYSIAQNALKGTTWEVWLDQMSEDVAEDMGLDPVPNVSYKLTDVQRNDLTSTAFEFWERRKKLIATYRNQLLFLRERGNVFFHREYIRRTQRELRALMAEVHHIGLEMVRPSTKMYANPSFFNCMGCQFKTPCDLRSAGGQYQAVLEYEYQPRIPWPKDETAAIAQWQGERNG